MNRILKPALMIMAVMLVLSVSLQADSAYPASSGQDIEGITKEIYPSVVRVEARNHTRKVATGVVIDKSGHIVTTALISPREEKITVTTAKGKVIDAEFLGFDNQTHLAVLRAKDKGLVPLSAGKADDLTPGAWICVVGISPERTASVTQGIVSSLTEDKMRLNVWVTPGSSGGPVVDKGGRMVGLLRGVYTEETPVLFEFRDREQVGSGMVFSRGEAPSSGMALAVPIEIVKYVSDEIKEKGKVERGWLGVTIGQNDNGQVVIVEVEEKSPAELAQLREKDVIVSIDGSDVTSSDKLAAIIRKNKPGKDVTLKIERNGKTKDVKVKLGEYPEDEARRELELRFPRLFPREEVPEPPSRIIPQLPERGGIPDTPRPPRSLFARQKYIGINCQELEAELARFFGIKEGTGLLISSISEGDPAEKAGLEVGDVIVSADGKRTETINELIGIIQEKKEGEKVKIGILRDRKARSIDVEVAQEDSGELFAPGGFQNSLQTWQDYTDAFRKEVWRWEGDYLPELSKSMKSFSEDLAKNGKEAFKDLKVLLRKSLKKV
jgi:S1-C subfamily serine protease